jgi:cell division septation protein DedD
MEKYLIELLETNNRVIVPDLGAFIIRQQDPQELVFNDLLAFNDGMLTSHIKQQEGISMSKAQVKIEEFVDQVKKVLTKGDIYHLENLGYLKMDDSSKIEFSVTKYPTSRAEVVSATTLSQNEEDEVPDGKPEEGIQEETPVPDKAEAKEEQAPVLEIPEEDAPFSEVPEEEAPVLDLPEEEAPFSEVPEEEAPVLDLTEEEAPEEESPAVEGAEWRVPEGNALDEEAALEEVTSEESEEKATEVGSFTLEDQGAEIEVDASEDTPLIPDAEEPPFLIEVQEQKEEKKATVVGTSQARLAAAAEAAADDEKKVLESEQGPMSATETNIPYYVEREKGIRNIWPWIGGAAAFIIILLVAAWLFFPDQVNRIIAGKSDKRTEQQVSGESTTPEQETTSGEEPESAETEQDQGAITGETDQSAVESIEEAVTEPEPEPEPETPPASQAKKYYIVAGMFSSRTNAEDYVKTLKAQGYDAELFGRKDNLYAVSFSSHLSKESAVQELNRIREQSNPKAWLLYY